MDNDAMSPSTAIQTKISPPIPVAPNKILPAYQIEGEIDTDPHFLKFFRYYKECPNQEVESFIRLIRDKEFLTYRSAEDEGLYRGRGTDIYMPNEDLKMWFIGKQDTKFLHLEEYHEMIDEKDWSKLDLFLQRLGVKLIPTVYSQNLTWSEASNLGVLGTQSGKEHVWRDKFIDGCGELLAAIELATSLLLWRILPELIQRLEGDHEWRYYGQNQQRFISSETTRLRTAKWLISKEGDLVSASEVTIQTLSKDYDTDSPKALALLKFLQIRDEAQDTAHLDDDEKRQIAIGRAAEAAGLTIEEAKEALAQAARLKSQCTPLAGIDTSADEALPANSSGANEHFSAGSSQVQRDILAKIPAHKKRQPSSTDTGSTQPGLPEEKPANSSDENDLEDTDDYSPPSVNYTRKIERAKERSAAEIVKLERQQELLEKSAALPKYSYGWFLALLELECMASSEKNADSKTISIAFGTIERDLHSLTAVILKQPSRFIPQSIEEFSGVRVDLELIDGSKKEFRIESFTAKEFSLLGKLKSAGELKGIDLDKVVEARIEVQNPSFLLASLFERFRDLGLADDFDMKAHLTPDIEFIFGPPGTGKTTHLAEQLLIPLMKGKAKAKVLVLTPTNKAADVLTTRIIEKMASDFDYRDWLVRFGTCADERIEAAGVRRDRSFKIDELERAITVTTIARFSYDGFSIADGKLYEIDWDMIVIDEASMIPLVNIIYPLYQRKPSKFVIAGDPFQIEPIVAVEGWKDENIYTLVGLNKPGAFKHPVTEPHNYPVTNLETQYRSIPAIGEIFSRFTYNGILAHHRNLTDQRPLSLDGLNVQPLNLIKFPVSRFESIYRAKRLSSGTPYQTYSALFTFEFVRWMAQQIEKNHGGEEPFRIGIIAPYRAQASLLGKLSDSWDAKPSNVEIQIGTIHGFQGDECDIIIAVLNPPPTISRSPQMFLNKQNILNVAISRARDWLFIVMPDEDTENIQNLQKVASIKRLVRTSGAFEEFDSHTVENLIFGNDHYLEENTFSTGHQLVNVYVKPERYYEVRNDDSAIDVQIHTNTIKNGHTGQP